MSRNRFRGAFSIPSLIDLLTEAGLRKHICPPSTSARNAAGGLQAATWTKVH